MAFLNKIIYLTLFFLSISVFASAEVERLAWTGREVDSEVLLQFVNKDENQIIEILRTKYEIKVVILEDKKEKKYNLTVGNLEEDQKLVEYLNRDPYREVLVKSYTPGREDHAVAQYMAPYEHVHDLREIKNRSERPGIDQHIIILTTSSSREDMIHEFMHAYLEITASDSPVVIDGIKHQKKCALFLEQKQLRQAQEAAIFSLAQEEDVLRATGKYVVKAIAYQKEALGEEIDIYGYIYKYREQLNLDPKDAETYVTTIRNYLNRLLIRISLGLELDAWVARWKKLPPSSSEGEESLLRKEIKNIFSEQLMNSLVDLDGKITRTTQWCDGQP